jgi:hypothetical protein
MGCVIGAKNIQRKIIRIEIDFFTKISGKTNFVMICFLHEGALCTYVKGQSSHNLEKNNESNEFSFMCAKTSKNVEHNSLCVKTSTSVECNNLFLRKLQRTWSMTIC